MACFRTIRASIRNGRKASGPRGSAPRVDLVSVNERSRTPLRFGELTEPAIDDGQGVSIETAFT